MISFYLAWFCINHSVVEMYRHLDYLFTFVQKCWKAAGKGVWNSVGWSCKVIGHPSALEMPESLRPGPFIRVIGERRTLRGGSPLPAQFRSPGRLDWAQELVPETWVCKMQGRAGQVFCCEVSFTISPVWGAERHCSLLFTSYPGS